MAAPGRVLQASTAAWVVDGGGGGAAKPCTNLCLQQKVCAGGATTSLSGQVFDPAGKVPLYNVIVYVPNAPVAALKSGASCDRCGDVSGEPLVSAITDTAGRFKLTNVPVGASIPVVIQVGKWRRQITIANVPECADTALAAEQTRPCARLRSTSRMARTPSASLTALHASRCRPPRSTSILSPPTRSRSFQPPPPVTKRCRQPPSSARARCASPRYADRRSAPRSQHRIRFSPVSRALTRSERSSRRMYHPEQGLKQHSERCC